MKDWQKENRRQTLRIGRYLRSFMPDAPQPRIIVCEVCKESFYEDEVYPLETGTTCYPCHSSC